MHAYNPNEWLSQIISIRGQEVKGQFHYKISPMEQLRKDPLWLIIEHQMVPLISILKTQSIEALVCLPCYPYACLHLIKARDQKLRLWKDVGQSPFSLNLLHSLQVSTPQANKKIHMALMNGHMSQKLLVPHSFINWVNTHEFKYINLRLSSISIFRLN